MRDHQRDPAPANISLRALAKMPSKLPSINVGVDLVSVRRIASSIRRIPALKTRVFSEDERRLSETFSPNRRAEWLAGRFAAKEAIAKAVGRNLYDVAPSMLFEVLRSANGSPAVRWIDSDLSAELANARCDVSISHDSGFAMAVAIVVVPDKAPDQ